MRICSLLSSATEIVYALGLGDELVAVTDRCDYPPEARQKPIASRSIVSQDLPSEEIDRIVQACIQTDRSIHRLDEEVIKREKPQLILTQDLCNVCDIGSNEVVEALRSLTPRPEILVLTPKTFWEALDNIRRVGQAAGIADHAEQVVGRLVQRVERVARQTMLTKQRPRVLCLEWMDPPMAAGHWLPEMVGLAGGVDGMGYHGLPGARRAWEEVVAYQPEVMLIQPCGFDISRTLREIGCVAKQEGWQEIPAVQSGRVYAVDSVYYTRPGPRLVDGLEILAQILHPEAFPGLIPSGAVMKLDPKEAEGSRPDGVGQCFHPWPAT